MQNRFDWSRPQRQPIAGLGIVFLNTFWEILKRMWPFLLIVLFRDNDEEKDGPDRFLIITFIFLGFTIISAILNFIFFKFYIEEGKLIIKKGWFKKETRAIPLARIQTVNIEQGPLHQLLNIVKLSIDTAGSDKAEAKIDALHLSMAEALRTQLVAEKKESLTEEEQPAHTAPLIRLTTKDLLKLSISANHVEAFFIFLSFGIGLYENLKNIDDTFFSGMQDALPRNSIYPLLFLVMAILIITILVSTARIFFGFYDFSIFKKEKNLHIRSGLTNIKQRVISYPKIQFVSWEANWIRKLMDLWMLEYHVAGGDEIRNKLKVQIPVTQNRFIPLLSEAYHPLPLINEEVTVRMHSSFIWRRLLIMGILPAIAIIPLVWIWWEYKALFYLFIPAIIAIVAWRSQIKFRLWALDDVLHIKKGIFGEERILMKWNKLQAVEVSQSIYQRKNGLANLILFTAGGNIRLYFISLQAAQAISNYVLYKTESSEENWM